MDKDKNQKQQPNEVKPQEHRDPNKRNRQEDPQKVKKENERDKSR